MNQFKCPHCGRMLTVQPVKLTVPKKERMQTFESTAPWQPSHSVPAVPKQEMPSFTEAKRQSPARPATVEGDFAVVALQALGCGVAICILAIGATLQWDLVWWTPVMALGGGFSAAWFILLYSQRKHLWIIETIFGQDIDGDGTIGESRQAEPFVVEWHNKEGKSIKREMWPISEEQVREIAEAHLRRDKRLSKREIAKHTSLSEEKALEVLAWMRSHKMARYADGQTTELTGKGKYLLSQILSS
jgi:hypothetical protein